MAELLNCPFCGGKVEAVIRGSNKQLVVFKCEEASTCIGSGLGTYAEADKLETAVSAWNRRAAIAAVEAEGWQTMDSAPRGGTQLLGYDAKTKTCHVTFAISKDDRWHDPDSHYYSECPPFDPTHWRHLPAAPEVD